MKNLLLILSLLLGLNTFAQFPITEDFNVGTPWTFVNGSGTQWYGGTEYYATTNLGTTPYPNGSTVTITSPVYDLTDCIGLMTVSFPLFGVIENGYDFMYFEYFDGGVWNTTQTFTGFQNATFTYTTIPNTATQFRFRLVTDATVNTYFTFSPPSTNVYYYDIASFSIICDAVLPIELVEFNGYNEDNVNRLYWITASELNNDYFLLERSTNGIDWREVSKVGGAGNSNSMMEYRYDDDTYLDSLNYYRLTQVDFDGKSETFKVIAIDNRDNSNRVLVKVVNLMGQEVDEYQTGLVLEIYSDGTTRKLMRSNQ